MTQKQLLSIVIPVHNESKNIPLIYKAIIEHTKALKYDFEIIYIDDGSRDDSAAQAYRLTDKDPNVRLLQFARNFGKEAAVSAGLHAAKGAAAIVIDADLQHPPELIKEFIRKWEKGAEVIVGVRNTYTQQESWFKKFSSKWFYRLMNGISSTKITPNATDYRLLDRTAIDAFNEFTEHNRMTRGLIDWLGFKRAYIKFDINERIHGKPTYNYKKLFQLAFNSITSHSMMPLKLAGVLGIIILLIAGPLGIFIFYQKYILNDPGGFNFTGTSALAVIVLFLVGVVLVCLGLIAMYIARIYEEVTNRPLYIVKQDTAADDEEVAA